MAIVVVGGHTRNIGKTTLATQILTAFAPMQWTAIKITQYGHGVCSANGEACDCVVADHSMAVSEQRSADESDTGRMVAAGAARVLWVRTPGGSLQDAMPRVRREMTGNVLLESNSVLRFVRPDLYLSVLQPAVADFKPSAVRYLDRASALFVPHGAYLHAGGWPGVSPALLRGKPVFPLHEHGLDEAATAWIRERLEAAAKSLP